jgi:DnaJ-class molecular chaperone
MSKDYYKILGVPKKADQKEIKQAYRKLARKHHPDVNPGNAEAEAKFKEISEAYQVLSDPENRKKYDRFGSGFEHGVPGSGGMDAGGFGDIFEQIFQNFGTDDPFQQVHQPAPAQDVEQEIEITLEEIDKGVKRTFSYQVPDACTKCHGLGQVQIMSGGFSPCPNCRGKGAIPSVRKVEVKIPAGIQDGKKLRVPGRGVQGSDGSLGDLYVVVKTVPNKDFKRIGDDLETEVEIPYTTAALGGKVRVPTLRTSGTISIPEGTQPGQRFRLKGRGLTKMSSGRGDLYAKVKITVPKKLSSMERQLLKEITQLTEVKL